MYQKLGWEVTSSQEIILFFLFQVARNRLSPTLNDDLSFFSPKAQRKKETEESGKHISDWASTTPEKTEQWSLIS